LPEGVSEVMMSAEDVRGLSKLWQSGTVRVEDAEAPPVHRAKNDLAVLGLGEEDGSSSDAVWSPAGAEATERMLMDRGRAGRFVRVKSVGKYSLVDFHEF